MYNVLISITDKGGGAKGKAGEDVFEDLLGSQGFSFSSGKDAGPRTMAEMKKVELAKNMDPEKLKVLYSVVESCVYFNQSTVGKTSSGHGFLQLQPKLLSLFFLFSLFLYSLTPQVRLPGLDISYTSYSYMRINFHT